MTGFANVDQLEDALSKPTDEVVESIGRLEGDILVLGAGGKMGPSLVRMAKRASDAAGVSRRVIAVDVFPSADQQSKLQSAGVETIRCDLLDQAQLDKLPDAPNRQLVTPQSYVISVTFSSYEGLVEGVRLLTCGRRRSLPESARFAHIDTERNNEDGQLIALWRKYLGGVNA